MLITCIALFIVAESGAAYATLPCSNTNPCRTFADGRPFREPLSYWSRYGSLEMTLVADISDISIDWLKLKRRTFNGRLDAPTWKIKPGDRVEVTVQNRLGPNPINQTGHNTLHSPNTTNIHVHGLHISPEGNADNVFVEIKPGQTVTYEYNIPLNHPAGTFWYHPHFHGSGAFQTMGGMSGLIIIQDDPHDWRIPYELRSVSCPYSCEHDIEMLMQPALQYSSDAPPVVYGEMQFEIGDDPLFLNQEVVSSTDESLADWLNNDTNGVNYFTVNGDLRPKMYFEVGQMKRMRLANAGGAHALELEVRAVNHPHKCLIREIALDGVYLDKPRLPRTGQTLILPGGRVDWMIRCDHPGAYQIVSNRKSENDPSMGIFDRFNGTLATIEVQGSTQWLKLDFPTFLPQRPAFMEDLRGANTDEAEKFVLEMSPSNSLNREYFPEDVSDRIRYKMHLNTLQEWTLINTGTGLLHPMHIHVNHFQVISYNKYTGPVTVSEEIQGEEEEEPQFLDRLVDQQGRHCQYQWEGFDPDIPVSNTTELPPDVNTTLGHEIRYYRGPGMIAYAEIGEWRDTIAVPPLSNITIRFIPTDFTGKLVIHCHNSAHADRGMFLLAEIEAGASTAGARVASNGALPGTCHPGDWYPGIDTSAPTTTIPSTTSTTTSQPITTMMMRRLDFYSWMYRFYPHRVTLLGNYSTYFYYYSLYNQWLFSQTD